MLRVTWDVFRPEPILTVNKYIHFALHNILLAQHFKFTRTDEKRNVVKYCYLHAVTTESESCKHWIILNVDPDLYAGSLLEGEAFSRPEGL